MNGNYRSREDLINELNDLRRCNQELEAFINSVNGDVLQKNEIEFLRESEEKYRFLFKNINEGFSLIEVIYDDEGNPFDFRYIEVNDAYEKATGLVAADIIGKTLREIAPDIERTRIELLSKVEITGNHVNLEDYNQSTGRYYDNHTFSFRKGYIAVLLRDITDRKKIENTLKEREELLRTVFEQLPVGVSVFNNDGQALLSNKLMKDYMPSRIPSRDHSRMNQWKSIDNKGHAIPPDQWPGARALRGESVIPGMEFVYSDQYGQENWIIVSASPYRSDDGKIIGGISVARDITKDKLGEVALRESEKSALSLVEELRKVNELNAAIIEYMSDGLFLLENDSNLTILNQGGKDFFYEPQYIKKSGDSFIHTKYYDMDRNELSVEEMIWRRALKGERIQNSRIKAVRPDKTVYFSLSGSPLYDSAGKITAAIICSRDITKQVEIENMIFQKKEQLEVLFESLTEGIFIADNAGNVVLINEEGKRQLNYSDIETLEQACNIIKYFDLQGNEITKDRMPGIRAMNGENVRNERMLLMKPDEEMYLSASATPIYDDNSNIQLIAVYGRDITEEINIQKSHDEKQIKLLFAEYAKNEALENAIKMKDEFLTTITHEFKTPLNVINAAVQTIETRYGNQLPDLVNKHLHRIKRNSYRQLRLVNNILDITRYNADHLKVELCNLDIVQLIKTILSSVDIYAIQKGVELNFSADIEHLEMAIDEEKFERSLLNLLSNAIKFTPNDKSINVHLSATNKKAIISVKDEGIGIPKSKQELIFERFGQVDSSLSRQAEGTGIGLYLVKTLIERMNGTIKVDSEVNKGSTFTVILPIKKLKLEVPDVKTGKTENSHDSRIIQAVAIEFSDHYL